ncbi:Cof-type HAD-IIB family hydrolase [Psychromonas sp. Urea-02u-13]|uniref:Cof-type HAD-IIB family hydrolase n=1 Tax=Psychromonas sp. Urea-02u-13 TaxID=2058326 RepID=UPI000C31D95B|nr:Cof-type HAD-IIB family hydrolase [Psychromonas sp. Urea-02u-13]PKG37361.1 Cof-type HAD-IIB family hydrolase [Psychromonas sp. Urea-02u-13]
MYKVAISDLDGTLLGPDHKISPESKTSIHNWIESGRKFIIATGRHYIEAKSLQDSLGEPIYLISSNGARVHNKLGEIILKQNLPSNIATQICNIEFDSSIQINLFTDEHWYANFRLKELDDIGLGGDFDCRATDIKALDKTNIIKVFFWAERELLEVVYQELKTLFGDRINLTFSLDKCLEVMDANTNKGTAVKAVLKEKGYTTEQAVAFGDGMNDVEMLSVVGKPMLMKNSQQALRDALPKAEMTLSAKEHGVSAIINQLLSE